MVILIGIISRERMGAGTLDTLVLLVLATQAEGHGSNTLVVMGGQEDIEYLQVHVESAGHILKKGTAGKLTADTTIQQTQRDIHPGLIGIMVGSIRVMRGDMRITMREMIDSLIGSLRIMKGSMIGLMTCMVAGMTIGMMTGRLIGLSQESRVRTGFCFLPSFCCMCSSELA